MNIFKYIWLAFKHDMLLIYDSLTYYERFQLCVGHIKAILLIVDDFNYKVGTTNNELVHHISEIKRLSKRGDITPITLREYAWSVGRFIDDEVWSTILKLWKDTPS